MACKTAQLLDTQQTVAVLVKHLGNPVAWAAWLADIRRTPRPGKEAPDLYGHQLAPYAKGQKNQPLYRPSDVRVFIDAVKASDPGTSPEKPHRYVFDDEPMLPWQWRSARRTITRLEPLSMLKAAA